jgi:flagellar protein FlgJ
VKIAGDPTIPLPRDIESLRGRTDPEAVRAAAREMESLFAYEMVKAMRAASGGPATGEGFGGDVYGTLFDMELAKVLANKGLGLQDLLLKGLGRAEYSKNRKANQAVEGNAVQSEAGVGLPIAARVPAAPAAAPPPVQPTALPPVAEAPVAAASPPASAPPAAPGPHTHDPLEESGRGTSLSGEDSLPVRDGGRISSGFGYRKDPLTGASKFHHGIDISAPDGTAIYPARGGEVKFSGYQQGYGNVVVIDHGDGFVTKYGHNRANRVAAGDRVDPGDVIAEVGSTGRSTGPHIHFEVRYEGKEINPEAVFAGIAKGRG